MRIMIADREASTRSALGMLARSQRDLALVGVASDAAELLTEVKAHHPDLVVLDWGLAGEGVGALLEELRLLDKPPAVVGLSLRAADRAVALLSGAAGFACKGDPPERLLAAIRAVGQETET